MQAARSSTHSHIAGTTVTAGYTPTITHVNGQKTKNRDLQHLLEQKILQQKVQATESESEIKAFREELSLNHFHQHEQLERYKTQLKDEIKVSTSLRQQLEKSLRDLTAQKQLHTQNSSAFQRIIGDLKEELRGMDLNLEMRNNLIGEKDRQLRVSESKRQMECSELTGELERLRKMLEDKDQQLETVTSERDSLQSNEYRRCEELERGELEKATKDKLMKVLHARVDEVKEGNRTLRRTITDSERHQLDLEERLALNTEKKEVAEKEVKCLQGRVSVLEKKISADSDEKKTLSAELVALKSDYTVLQTKSNARDDEFKRIRAILDELMNSLPTVDLQRLLDKKKEDRRADGWSDKEAIERALRCMDELEELTCKEKQLAFEDLPWPVLDELSTCGPKDVTKESVEKFFAAAEAELRSGEYWNMLEKMYRAFRDEEGEKRGLWVSVTDERLRDELQAARQIVWGVVEALLRGW
ncbi:hypothetical protein DFS33DRAFT_1083190 [Desarmillaria ectypa]|nr:hypothetical protein DFS33DRAFT_1083190 [Desarmillaria ectypa]